MGSIILCHKKKAEHPYEISRVHHKIYTIEELCYYMCNNLYLIDYTIVNEKLCDWLEEELELIELTENLRQVLHQHGSVEQFIVTILAHSSIYTTAELKGIRDILEKLKNQKPIEKQKYKADNLLQNGALKSAILIYQSIIYGETDDSVDGRFYGKVYACLGAAYGRLFLYEEAAKMYETAFQICEEESMLKAYVYACKQYMPQKEYKLFISKSQVYQGMDSLLEEEMREVEKELKISLEADTLEKWKEQYRKTGTGEM